MVFVLWGDYKSETDNGIRTVSDAQSMVPEDESFGEAVL
jgi:hypothetical protein